MVILDTNTISHLRDSRRWTEQFARWESQSDLNETYISVISEFEIQYGINHVLPSDPHFAGTLQDWFDTAIKIQFQERLIPINSEICHVAAKLAQLPSRYLPDLLIAATALVHDLTVVTRNVKHFKDTGVRILNPWD
jgi:hypothetical protein